MSQHQKMASVLPIAIKRPSPQLPSAFQTQFLSPASFRGFCRALLIQTCNLRTKGHNFVSPQCQRDIYKKTFVPRNLYKFL
jgi:hypothetical protein